MLAEYMSFDPGNKTGWAAFDTKGKLIESGMVVVRAYPKSEEFNIHELKELLNGYHPDIIICEKYTLFQQKALAQSGSDMLASQIIGHIRSWADDQHPPCKVYFQPSDVKPVAYRWANVKKPRNKNESHEKDAYVHGVYWLIKNNIRKPK